MSTWVIGDIQGCFETFMKLLGRLEFKPGTDRLWLVGDLVNRGPSNVDVLHWVREHRRSVRVVLGNHDIHLIACMLGVTEARSKDTIHDVIHAPEGPDLTEWLRSQPVIHATEDDVLVHAGLHPSWTVEHAMSMGQRLEKKLRSNDCATFLAATRDPSASLSARDRELIHALNVFTRMRVLRANGDLQFSFKGEVGSLPPGLTPWFRVRPRRYDSHRVFFGHWAALGHHEEEGCICVDTGCVWKRSLTAFRLEDGVLISEPTVDEIQEHRFSTS